MKRIRNWLLTVAVVLAFVSLTLMATVGVALLLQR